MGGCIVSTLIGALWCRKRCDASELAGEFAYFPPSPASYQISRDSAGELSVTLNAFYFQARHAASLTRTQAQVVELHTASGVTTPAFLFRHAGAKLTILFSHSNAVDVGILYKFLGDLSSRLGVNVFAYEFSGYGPTISTATPRNHTQRHDVEAAYDFLCNTLKIDPVRQLIAFGQSIGSYPTLHIAATRPVLGVVLHSPIAAGLQVITKIEGCCAPHRVFSCLEPYPNTKLASRIRDPVLIIHGTADETVELSHGQSLYARLPAAAKFEPYWVQGATHEDVIEVDEPEYFRRISRFLEACELRISEPELNSTRSHDALVSSNTRRERSSAWDMRGLRPVPEPELASMHSPPRNISSSYLPQGGNFERGLGLAEIDTSRTVRSKEIDLGDEELVDGLGGGLGCGLGGGLGGGLGVGLGGGGLGGGLEGFSAIYDSLHAAELDAAELDQVKISKILDAK